MGSLILKPGREKSLLRRHPWIFSGAVSRVDSDLKPGDMVAVRNADGDFLAWGDFSPASQIISRIWSWREDQPIDSSLIGQLLMRAIEQRESNMSRLWGMDTNALRLVYAEADGIPGLVADRYDDVIVLQFLTAGVDRLRNMIVDLMVEVIGVRQIYERSDVDVRKLEGLELRNEALRGSAPSNPIEIVENGLHYFVDVVRGHKTGFYLDQRINRNIARNLAEGRELLDCFCYTGGFSCAAAAGGAKSIVAIDTSNDALKQVHSHWMMNQVNKPEYDTQEEDVFHGLRHFRDRNRTFDMIILDPPKFAWTQRQVNRASRGYKDINLLAFKLLRSGGLLMTFSCSGNIDENLFQKIVMGAAQDAGVDAKIIARLQQAPDHPVGIFFPESAYLKGFLVQI